MQNIDIKKVGGMLVGLLLILGVVAYNLGWLDSLTNKNDVGTNNNSNNVTQSTQYNNQTLQVVQTADNSSDVGIQSPPAPVNGRIRSITMVGPSGVYCSIVQTDGRNYKLIKKAFQPMPINDEAALPSEIRAVIQGFINDSWNNGVSSKGDIQLVVASSLTNNPKIKSITDELKKVYNVNNTSSETEGAGAFKVAVAPQYQNNTFVMDVTPTIIRFTFSTGSGTRTLVAKTGSQYFKNSQSDEQAFAEIRQVISQIPRNSQQNCLVLWAAAEKDLRQGSNRYSVIPSYSGQERSTISGLKLINEVKNLTNAKVVIDYESMWFSSF